MLGVAKPDTMLGDIQPERIIILICAHYGWL